MSTENKSVYVALSLVVVSAVAFVWIKSLRKPAPAEANLSDALKAARESLSATKHPVPVHYEEALDFLRQAQTSTDIQENEIIAEALAELNALEVNSPEWYAKLVSMTNEGIFLK